MKVLISKLISNYCSTVTIHPCAYHGSCPDTSPKNCPDPT